MFGLVSLATASACFADFLVIGLIPKPLNVFCVVQNVQGQPSSCPHHIYMPPPAKEKEYIYRDWLLRSFAGIIRPKATPPTPNSVQHPISRLQICRALLDCLVVLVGNLTLADLLSRAETCRIFEQSLSRVGSQALEAYTGTCKPVIKTSGMGRSETIHFRVSVKLEIMRNYHSQAMQASMTMDHR